MNVTSGERNELMALQRSRTAAVAQVRRARLILLLDEGQPWSAIKQELRCDSRFISTWGGRFVQARLGGLFARHSGRAPTRDPARLEARVLERTLKHKPRDGSPHWSSRKLYRRGARLRQFERHSGLGLENLGRPGAGADVRQADQRAHVPAGVSEPSFECTRCRAAIAADAQKKGSSPICVKQKAGARAPLLPWWYQASRRQEGDRGPGASYYPAGRLGGI